MITIQGSGKLAVRLSTAVSTNPLTVVGSFSEYSTELNNAHRYSDAFTCAVSGTQSVNALLPNSINSIVREIQYVGIKNSDTDDAIVWIDFVKGSTQTGILSANLSPGDTLYYEKGNGWRTIDINGSIKQSISSTAINDLTEIVNSFVAGEVLGGQRVVMIVGGEAFHYDPTDENNAGRDIGITKGAAIIGAMVEVVSKGIMTGFSGSLVQDSIYYAGSSGTLTDTIPTGPGIDMRVGVAVDANTLNINFSEPCILI